jgi:predicted RNA-binding protein
MAYFIDLFSPETYLAFARSTRDISGFRIRHKNTAEKIKPGDIFVCYLTKLSRWFGLLEVVDGPFIDDEPIFLPENDPFVVRFRVRPTVWLDIEKGIPIHDRSVWDRLSFTRDLKEGGIAWTGKVRSSVVQLGEQDGILLAERLTAQAVEGRLYPLDEQDQRKVATHTVNRPDKVVVVSVPEDADTVGATERGPETEARESICMQAELANIGAKMGMKIWIPRADRGGVLREWANEGGGVA